MKIALVKFGGHALSEEGIKNLIFNIKYLLEKQYGVVICHGGTPSVDLALKARNIPSVFKNGLRVTSAETMKTVEETILGGEALDIVGQLNEQLIHAGDRSRAVSLSGNDAFCVRCHKRTDKDIDYGLVGKIDSVDTRLIEALMERGFIPVVSPIGVDEKGLRYNLNSDHLAGTIAIALKADLFLMITNVNGVLEDLSDVNSRIPVMNVADYDRYKASGKIYPAMVTKLDSMFEYVETTSNDAFLLSFHERLCNGLLNSKNTGTRLICSSQIRYASLDDIPMMLDLARSSFPRYQEHIKTDYCIAPLKETKENVAEAIQESDVLLYEEKGCVIGQIRVRVEERIAKVSRLCVLPEYQGKSIGTKLLHKAEEIAHDRGCSAIGLTSLIKVNYLDGFYQKNGYELLCIDEKTRNYPRSVYVKRFGNRPQPDDKELINWLLARKEK